MLGELIPTSNNPDILDHSDLRGRENCLACGESMLKMTSLSTVEDFDFRAPNQDSSKVTLFKILDDPETKGKVIHYN
jgi:hypothetical protein